jgi:hypothetical protein
LAIEKSYRGAAFGDYDNDGDIDVVISALDDRPTLLRNDTTGGHWFTMRLAGTTSNRSAIGAKVTIEAGGRRQVAEVRSGGSYISHNDSRVHFGLGDATGVDSLTVRWPTGKMQTERSLAADRFYVAVKAASSSQADKSHSHDCTPSARDTASRAQVVKTGPFGGKVPWLFRDGSNRRPRSPY